LSPLPIVSAASPEQYLKNGNTLKGGAKSWEATMEWLPKNAEPGYFLGLGRRMPVIVLSQDCEIDKDKKILVAPVLSIETVTGDALAAVREGKRYPFMHVPEIEGVLPESYVDLRYICFVDKRIVNISTRLRSMSAEGLERLQAQVIAFFTHIPLSELKIPPR
jgi:hypothetical protein